MFFVKFLILMWIVSYCISINFDWHIFRAFFDSLYRSLARGARAVFQVYPENLAQRELILGSAMRAGFSGGVVVDFPHRYIDT